MPAATAAKLLRELGPEALESARLCVEECRRLGDRKAEQFWDEVAARLECATKRDRAVNGVGGDPANDVYFKRRRWMLMQKVELYRRKAINAERLAGGSEAHRDEMIDIALQWFELARQYEWLSDTL